MSQEHLIYYASNNGLLRKHHGITLEMNAVLLSMLEHANPKTGEISVGVSRLREETELHGKSIDKAIDKLISNGVIEKLPKVKYGRAWVNAYQPTLFGMITTPPTPPLTTPPTPPLTTPPTNPPTNTADDSLDEYGADRMREHQQEQVRMYNENLLDNYDDSQPEPKPKSEPQPEAHSTDNDLGLDARQRILELAVKVSFKKRPPRQPAGDALWAKKKKNFDGQLIRTLPSISHSIIYAINKDPLGIYAEMLAELIQCQFEDEIPDQKIKGALFNEPCPEAISNLPPIFKNPDDQ
jgi:hypothetical protein